MHTGWGEGGCFGCPDPATKVPWEVWRGKPEGAAWGGGGGLATVLEDVAIDISISDLSE